MLCCPFSFCWMLPLLPALVRLLLPLPLVGPLLRALVGAVFPSLLDDARPAGCCPKGAWPRLESDDDRVLSGETVPVGGGLSAYVSAPPAPTGRAVIVVHDVFGVKGGRTRTICDVLAAEGFLTILPDFFGDGDSIDNHGGLVNIGSDECVAWLRAQAWAGIEPKLEAAAAYAAAAGAQRVAIVGFCWGAWVAAKASGTGLVRAAVHVHPSWQISSWLHGEPEAEMAGRIRAHTLLMPAADDREAFRDGTYARLIERRGGPSVRLVPFPTMRHGFVTRGAASDPEVMAEVERALREAAAFLHSKLPPAPAGKL